MKKNDEFTIGEEVTELRVTENYILYEGTGASKGCYFIRRLADDAYLDWYCGEEAIAWKDKLMKKSKPDFDKACMKEFVA